MLTMCSKAPDIYVGGEEGVPKLASKDIEWPVEFHISYELSFLPGHVPGVGQDVLDRCYCGFAGMCCLCMLEETKCFCFCTRVHGKSES